MHIFLWPFSQILGNLFFKFIFIDFNYLRLICICLFSSYNLQFLAFCSIYLFSLLFDTAKVNYLFKKINFSLTFWLFHLFIDLDLYFLIKSQSLPFCLGLFWTFFLLILFCICVLHFVYVVCVLVSVGVYLCIWRAEVMQGLSFINCRLTF